MRNFKMALLLTAAITVGDAAASTATQPQEKQRYEAFFTREMSDGIVLYSEKKHMRVSRIRKGREAVTMYDELNGAAALQTAIETTGGGVQEPEERPVDFAYRYDYATQRMHGPEAFTRYFNHVIRPLMIKHDAGGGPFNARFAVTLAQLDLPRLKGAPAIINVNKRYADFEGRRFALISFDIPAFAYTSAQGEQLVHWANGAAITDAKGGVTYYLAVRHRASAGAGTAAARPMYVEQSSHATDEEGRALLDLRRFAAGRALIDGALKGETGRPGYHLARPTDQQIDAMANGDFFAAAAGLTVVGLSVAEGSPNAPGGTAAAGSGGQITIAGGSVQLPTRPGSRQSNPPSPPPPPPPKPFLPMPGEEDLPGAVKPPAAGTAGAPPPARKPPQPFLPLPGEENLPGAIKPPGASKGKKVLQLMGKGAKFLTKGLGGIGALLDAEDFAGNIGRLAGSNRGFGSLEDNYADLSWQNAAGRIGGYILNAANPLSILEDAADIRQAIAGSLEANRQELLARRQEIELSQRRTQQIRDEGRRIQELLGQIDADIAEINRLKTLALTQAQKYRDALRQQGGGSEQATETERQPQLPGDPDYPTLTKEQRDAISQRAKERRERLKLEQEFGDIGDLGDAFDGTLTGDLIGAEGGDYDWGDLSGTEITTELLNILFTEQMLAAEERRQREKAAWDKLKANHQDLTELFGDFIENNMFDFGGLTGKGLSGVIATDLSPYAEWLLEQDINRLNALARAAGYPNLAAALADSRNLIAKARDTGFRQWAWSPGVGTGAIGLWASEAQHELARAQVLLGDLLNDSRFIDSTAGLSDLAISGTTLTAIFRDFGLEDGDIIDITITQLGQTLFRQRLSLTNAGTAIQSNLRQGVGRVEIFAVNEGFASPNTAEITIDNVVDGDPVQQYQLRTGEIAILRVQTGR